MNDTQKPARGTTSKGSKVFTDEERAAMSELVQERRRERSGKADGESDVLAKIANLDEGDMWPTSFALKRLTADVEERIAALVKTAVS